ncbi:MAG: bacteriohopanetetrol glucosamine biosynthesis glycosyltransferase HpnI [Terriglobales bacterium]
MHLLLRIAQVATALLAAAGCPYCILCLWSARNFRRRRAAATGFAPPVSILKPLRGADPEMYEAFRSHCLQDYSEYELIFGVSDPHDPAIALIERLQREFPALTIRLAHCPEALGPNVKVSNLAQMLPLARYDHLIVNDSDIRVPPDYLRRVMADFTDPRVGMVTCLYRGIAGPSLGSRLESIGISTDFAAGVLAARYLEGISFGLGSTLAFSRRALDAIGGFQPLAEYLADDYELGHRIAAAGFEVQLSDVVVDTHLPAYSFSEFVAHQLRWYRAIRDSRPAGYAGMILTFVLPWALAALLLSGGSSWGWALFVIAFALRIAVAFVIGEGVLHDAHLRPRLPLLPLRDIGALLLWASSFAGHTITWRGDKFVLDQGKLRPVKSAKS